MTRASILGRRLSGRTIFMSASVPSPDRAEKFRRIPDAAMEIEQAVVALARAVFAEDGRLVFGGHPSISPLVAMVAGEYRAADRADGAPPGPRVLIYQSDLFRGRVARDTLLMSNLDLAELVWTPKHPAETYGKAPAQGPKYPLSLERMRRAMIGETRPEAMVCIGGMEGVIEEAGLFAELRPGRPLFLLRRTGGAASVLAQTQGPLFEVIDDEIMVRMRLMDRRSAPGEVTGNTVPYPLIMQTIVDKVAAAGSGGAGQRRRRTE